MTKYYLTLTFKSFKRPCFIHRFFLHIPIDRVKHVFDKQTLIIIINALVFNKLFLLF